MVMEVEERQLKSVYGIGRGRGGKKSGGEAEEGVQLWRTKLFWATAVGFGFGFLGADHWQASQRVAGWDGAQIAQRCTDGSFSCCHILLGMQAAAMSPAA